MTSGLYTNRTSHRDLVVNALNDLARDGCNVFIAVAFFTETSVIERLLEKGCHVRLVVRLGFPTNAGALQKLLGLPSVSLRYFTGREFHPKLYIFGDKTALVGSANLTHSAIHRNQEVVISIESDDPRFDELNLLFGEYWEQAKVLDAKTLEAYAKIYSQYDALENSVLRLGEQVLDKLGDFSPANIKTNRPS
ncbi:MAG: phospholipase D-like domain-containing protein, partial [Casimicrobium sp.]